MNAFPTETDHLPRSVTAIPLLSAILVGSVMGTCQASEPPDPVQNHYRTVCTAGCHTAAQVDNLVANRYRNKEDPRAALARFLAGHFVKEATLREALADYLLETGTR